MRKVAAAFVSLFTVALICMLDHAIGSLPALGRLLDPVNGALANADPVNRNFAGLPEISGCTGPVTVSFESRMVPHIQATNDHDLYFAQGYLHAYFRLWQMDMQTRAAAGRISEILGDKAILFDRRQRRKGMVYAAEQSLAAMQKEPRTGLMLDAYTEGVNAYITSLRYRDYPLEYKLIGFMPERWDNLKCALLLKYMADDLTGASDDFALTYLRDQLPAGDFDVLFRNRPENTIPVIPRGTDFGKPSMPVPSAPVSDVFIHFGKTVAAFTMPERSREAQSGIGSNNWAVSGSLTASGSPILCNDPHLGLNLPSLWFEAQLQAPGINTYGVSLPGAPGIIIGFNDSISWGFTNNYRDVKDFYQIKPLDKDHYLFNGAAVSFVKRVETIKVKNGASVLDTVCYTVHGPVIYDEGFESPVNDSRLYAMTWMAHRGTNELLSIYLLNRAVNYSTYVQAIGHFECPAQNFIYADRSGNIAMWGQGRFINKWKGQGAFVMEGQDSLTLWGADIPMSENPHVLNPPQGYVASANQCVTDTTYPYWYNGDFAEYRSWRINHILGGPVQVQDYARPFTVQTMQQMQNDVYSFLARQILDRMLDDIEERKPEGYLKAQADSLRHWQYKLNADSRTATLFQIWWYFLYNDIWQDDFDKVPDMLYPSAEITQDLIVADTLAAQTYFAFSAPPEQSYINKVFKDFALACKYFDDKRTPAIETRSDIFNKSFRQACDSMRQLEKMSGTAWYRVKNTTVNHLAKLPAFSYSGLHTGGWGNAINAMKKDHGPSWRMIVAMDKDSIRAYGVYPGGQSGNPGSPYYADFLDKWVNGQYYRILFLAPYYKQHPALKYIWRMHS